MQPVGFRLPHVYHFDLLITLLTVCSSPCEYAREEAEDAQVQRQRVTALSQRLLERERRVVALKEALAQKMSSPSMYRGCMGKENVAWDPSSRIS